jgi:hypothetical protein
MISTLILKSGDANDFNVQTTYFKFDDVNIKSLTQNTFDENDKLSLQLVSISIDDAVLLDVSESEMIVNIKMSGLSFLNQDMNALNIRNNSVILTPFVIKEYPQVQYFYPGTHEWVFLKKDIVDIEITIHDYISDDIVDNLSLSNMQLIFRIKSLD